MSDRGATAFRIAVGLVVWTFVVDVFTWWIGVWDAVWGQNSLDDPGTAQAEAAWGLLVTSGLWLAGAIVLVALALWRASRK
jgi:hypothetical protein